MADDFGRNDGMPESGEDIDFVKLYESAMAEEDETASSAPDSPIGSEDPTRSPQSAADAPKAPKAPRFEQSKRESNPSVPDGVAGDAGTPQPSQARPAYTFSQPRPASRKVETGEGVGRTPVDALRGKRPDDDAQVPADRPSAEPAPSQAPEPPAAFRAQRTTAMPAFHPASRPRDQAPEPPQATQQPQSQSPEPQRPYSAAPYGAQSVPYQPAAPQQPAPQAQSPYASIQEQMRQAQAEADAVPEPAEADESAGNRFGTWLEYHKKPVIAGAAAAAAVVVAAALVLGQSGQSSDDQAAPQPADPGNAAASSSSSQQATTKTVTFSATADGWQQSTSTPLILHIAGSTADGQSVDTYRAVPASGESHLDMASGTYQIATISPINADGSIYTVPGAASLTVDVNDPTDAIVQLPLQLVAANDVTQQQVESVLAQIQTAVNTCSSDSSAGELYSSGSDIVARAAANAANAPAEVATAQSAQSLQDGASADASDASSSDTGDIVSNPYDIEEAGDGSESVDAGSAVTGADADSSSSVDAGSTASASSSANAPENPNASSGTTQTTEGKTWHDPVTRTVHHEASTRTVYVNHSICKVCGEDITGKEVEHTKQHAQAGEGGGWTTKQIASSIIVTPEYDSTEVVTPGGWW